MSIVGRQQFTLPLFWQVFDLDLLPDLKSTLVTHAYQTFFDRTVANFEALVEGRDVRIGSAVDEATPLPVEQLMPVLQKIGEIALPLLERIVRPASPDAVGADGWVDGDGFTHVSPVSGSSVDARSSGAPRSRVSSKASGGQRDATCFAPNEGSGHRSVRIDWRASGERSGAQWA